MFLCSRVRSFASLSIVFRVVLISTLCVVALLMAIYAKFAHAYSN